MRTQWILVMVIVAFLIAAGAAAGEPTLTVKCKKMGAVAFTVEAEGTDLVAVVAYPKPIREYLGGFGKDGVKNYSAGVKIYLDADANPKTGLEGDPQFDPGMNGAEWCLRADEISTSLARGDQGGWIDGPMLEAMVEKGDDYAELPEGVYPAWELEVDGAFKSADWVKPPDSRRMRLRLPMEALELKPGQKVRVTGVVDLCNDAFPYPGTAEATITLK
jgi:hypothetical protein